MKKIDAIVIHCTATRAGQDVLLRRLKSDGDGND